MKGWLGSTLLVATLAMASPANANWTYQGEKSAFGSQGTHLAATANASYGLGFRCEPGEALGVFVTPEDLTQAEALTLALQFPKLLIRVDDLAVHEHYGVVESSGGKLRISAAVKPSLLEQVRNARRRIAVAVRMSDETFHETSFSAWGSTSAIQRFVANCEIKDGSD